MQLQLQIGPRGKLVNSKIGTIRASDGAVLSLRIAVIDVRESGFSPFGGVNFSVKTVGGIAILHVPDELKNQVKDKPLAPPTPPPSGWQILEIVEQDPAFEEVEVETSRGEKYLVKVIAEATMVSRNLEFKTEFDEPLYWVSWVYKIKWKPLG